MPYEKGGRADKLGNEYEKNWIIYNLLKVIQEKPSYVIIEPSGDKEDGIDLLIAYKDDKNDFQQCKANNRSEDHWKFCDINAKGLWNKWKNHLDRDNNNTASIVSPLPFTLLEVIISRALNNGNNPNDFYNIQIKESGKSIKQLFDDVCKQLIFNTNPTSRLTSPIFKKNQNSSMSRFRNSQKDIGYD